MYVNKFQCQTSLFWPVRGVTFCCVLAFYVCSSENMFLRPIIFFQCAEHICKMSRSQSKHLWHKNCICLGIFKEMLIIGRQTFFFVAKYKFLTSYQDFCRKNGKKAKKPPKNMRFMSFLLLTKNRTNFSKIVFYSKIKSRKFPTFYVLYEFFV